MAAMAAAPQRVVLLVEDDPGDVLLVREAFGQSAAPSQLHAVGDGGQAMNFLRRRHGFTDAPRPGLILLDLDLPRHGGLEFLAGVKADPGLLMIPVVVLTSSHSPADIRRCYALHANAYVTKPADFHGMLKIIQRVAGCFLDLIELPD
jgi:CheY-like chemotaxis protein